MFLKLNRIYKLKTKSFIFLMIYRPKLLTKNEHSLRKLSNSSALHFLMLRNILNFAFITFKTLKSTIKEIKICKLQKFNSSSTIISDKYVSIRRQDRAVIKFITSFELQTRGLVESKLEAH